MRASSPAEVRDAGREGLEQSELTDKSRGTWEATEILSALVLIRIMVLKVLIL